MIFMISLIAIPRDSNCDREIGLIAQFSLDSTKIIDEFGSVDPLVGGIEHLT